MSLLNDLADGALAERVAAYAEARDRQARAIAKAACAYVSEMGECENSYRAAVPEDPYCEEENCRYCALARTMEGYDDQG